VAVSTVGEVGSTVVEAASTAEAVAFTAEAQAFTVVEALEAPEEAEALVAFAADEVSAAFTTEALMAFVVAEALAVFAATEISTTFVATAFSGASAVSRSSLISDSASGPTGVGTPMGTDMARGGGLPPITLPTTTLTILTTLRLIAIVIMIVVIVVIGTIAAVRTIAIPTTGAMTVPRTPLNQAARTLPQGLQILLSRRALLTGIM